MDRVLITADDFTGVLDTGIQFCKMGVRVKVVTEYQYDFESLDPDVSVLVVNTDSRPLSPREAYDRVYTVVSGAVKAGFRNFYKKTDSGLRGNLGPELLAALDASGEQALHFIPALPRLNRITRDGIAYIDGVPVKDSVFGRDPFEPVLYSDVQEIIQSKADVRVIKIPAGQCRMADPEPKEKTIYIYDAESEDDLDEIAQALVQKKCFSLCAGNAGFAAHYDRMLSFEKGRNAEKLSTKGLLALCGSVNPITVNQLCFAGEHGFARGNLSCEQKLNTGYFSSKEGKQYLDELYETCMEHDRYIIDTLDMPENETVSEYMSRKNLSADQCRVQIADSLGIIAMEMIRRGLNRTFSLTGGDTLMGLMRAAGVRELMPVCEIGKGAVLSIMEWKDRKVQVISKSGGFGEPEIFNLMYDTVVER